VRLLDAEGDAAGLDAANRARGPRCPAVEVNPVARGHAGQAERGQQLVGGLVGGPPGQRAEHRHRRHRLAAEVRQHQPEVA
jgi:hypothetical protein